MNQKKETAKFFAGVAANQVMTHGAFAATGLEFTLFGIAYTTRLNALAVVVWLIVLVLLFTTRGSKSNGEITSRFGSCDYWRAG